MLIAFYHPGYAAPLGEPDKGTGRIEFRRRRHRRHQDLRHRGVLKTELACPGALEPLRCDEGTTDGPGL